MPDSSKAIIDAYVASRSGQRGIEAYAWFVAVLRSHPGSTSTVTTHGGARAVVTVANGAAVLHSLTGDPADAAQVIEKSRQANTQYVLRGMALPGDRQTKNLFEEARLPAQVLLH
jgi:hypothetical protein